MKYWMTFNEINNQSNYRYPLFGYCCSGVDYTQKTIRNRRCTVLHHQFVASAQVVKLGHQINPEFKIGCMLACVPFYPYSCKPDDVMYAVEAMHQRYLYTDVQMRGYYLLPAARLGTQRAEDRDAAAGRADPARGLHRLHRLQLLHEQRPAG